MLGLGWTEMLVIGVMALIFIGPKDLPVVMNRIGKIVGQVKRMGTEFQREINKTTGLDEVRNLRNSITAPLKKTTDEIRKEFNAMTPTGAKPSGAIKPADPAAESVVNEIKAKAGMTEPTAPLKADDVAKAAGFKPAGPAPTTSSATFGKPSTTDAAKAPAKANAAPTSPVVTTDLAPVEAPAAKKSAVKKAAPKKAAGTKPAAKPVTTKAPVSSKVAAKPVAAKPVAAKPAATKKPVAAGQPASTAVAKPALAKPAPAKSAPAKRAPATPRIKPATTTADKAGDE